MRRGPHTSRCWRPWPAGHWSTPPTARPSQAATYGTSSGTAACCCLRGQRRGRRAGLSEEHTSELQSPCNIVCRLLLEKKKTHETTSPATVRQLAPLTLLTTILLS